MQKSECQLMIIIREKNPYYSLFRDNIEDTMSNRNLMNDV